MSSELKSDSSGFLIQQEDYKILSHQDSSTNHEPKISRKDHEDEKAGCNSNEEELYLPFSTFLARKIFKSEHLEPNQPTILQRLIRSLSCLIIKKLANLEDIFIRSKVYRIFKKLIPSFFPTSSIYPFVISLIFSGFQIRKFWIWQRHSFIQLLITLGPLFSTFEILMKLQQQHFTSNSTVEKNEIKRWLSYWIIYSLINNLESIKVWSKPNSILQTNQHISLYPSTSNLPNLTTQNARRIWNHSRRFLLHFISQSFTSKQTRNRKSFPEPRPHSHQTHSKDIYHTVPFLHDRLLGENSITYLIIKVIFLKWCSSDSNRGSEQIWNHIFSPFVSLITPTSSPKSEPEPTREMKIIIVTKPHQPEVDRIPIKIPATDLTQDITESNRISDSQHSLRRIRSDPIPSSICSDPEISIKTDDLTDSSSRISIIKKPLFAHEFRTPENAWDSLSFVA